MSASHPISSTTSIFPHPNAGSLDSLPLSQISAFSMASDNTEPQLHSSSQSGPEIKVLRARLGWIYDTETEKRTLTWNEELLKSTGQPFQINLYSGVVHGFAARADLSNAHIKTCKELAFLQALNWFQYYL